MGLEEAILAYTAGIAYAEFTEAESSPLEAGKLADCVALSWDVPGTGLGAEGGLKVLLTVPDEPGV